jgi:hypothetical protein
MPLATEFDAGALWAFLIPGYLCTVAIETPVLFLCLSKPHNWKTRLIAGLWLSACTYPMVVLVFPMIWSVDTHRGILLAVAEPFAHLAECFLFWLAFQRGRSLTWGQWSQDMAAVILANLASFLIGEWWRLLS